MTINIVDKEYIGDAVYAIYDGSGVWLYANDLVRPTDMIYLEPAVIRALANFVKKHSIIEGL